MTKQQLLQILDKLSTISRLPQGWDDMRAKEITYVVLSTALRIVSFLATHPSFTPPQIFPLPDGGMQIEWHIDNNDLEIEIDPIGNLYVLGNNSEGKITFDQVFSLDTISLPTSITSELERISQIMSIGY